MHCTASIVSLMSTKLRRINKAYNIVPQKLDHFISKLNAYIRIIEDICRGCILEIMYEEGSVFMSE